MPSFDVFRKHAGPIILLAVVLAFQQMDGYVTGTYFISFMQFAGVPLATIATILLLSRIADAVGVLLSGPFAEFCKRRLTAYLAIGLTTLLSYPFVLAILRKQILLIALFGILVSFFGIGVLHGLASILTSESFPTKFRYSGAGISYSASSILGGMIAPSLLAGLIGRDIQHKAYYVPIIYCIYCVAAMVALLFIPETRDRNLQDLDRAELRHQLDADTGNAKIQVSRGK